MPREAGISEESTTHENLSPKTRIYWAVPKGMQLANFQPEVKQAGSIIQAEAPLVFVDHVHVTDDPKEQGFIENSDAFKSGKIKKVSTLAEAAKLTQQVGAIRQVREIESSHIERAVVPEQTPTRG